jgi:hypothetical protein
LHFSRAIIQRDGTNIGKQNKYLVKAVYNTAFLPAFLDFAIFYLVSGCKTSIPFFISGPLIKTVFTNSAVPQAKNAVKVLSRYSCPPIALLKARLNIFLVPRPIEQDVKAARE